MPSVLRDDELAVLGAVPLTAADPERIGRYRLLGCLGAGGMGRVYLGGADGRLVAVKVVRTELADSAEFRRRFTRELAAVSRLTGAYTAALVDSDVDADRPWMATEYVAGVSLADAVSAERPLPVPAVWGLATGIGDALVAIHQAGLIHRDLKPSNVILGRDGPKVIDFGIVHAANLSELTTTGTYLGTAAYTAPEQARTGRVTPVADVFSLGALLVFAATGATPWGEGSTTDVLFRVVHEPPELSALAAVDAALCWFVEWCLAKEPADRPDAAAVAEFARNATESAADWPETVRTRVEARATLAARPLPPENALANTVANTLAEPPSVVAAPALPADASPPVRPPRRGRRYAVLGALLAVIAIGAGVLVRQSHGSAAANRPAVNDVAGSRPVSAYDSSSSPLGALNPAATGTIPATMLTEAATPSTSHGTDSPRPSSGGKPTSTTAPAPTPTLLTMAPNLPYASCSGSNTATSFGGECNGTGPTSFRAVAWCTNGTGVAGIRHWYGDSRGSTATCGAGSKLSGDWGYFKCAPNGTTVEGYVSKHGNESGPYPADICSRDFGQPISWPT